ncbi:cytochrome c peroxidase [Tundrisphaera sp. TA3]|uniref:cytochrome c peroxidase n=1 Tax=Tundrisphaera sp. TA3 TaxID=3435775 RepID=UPI003EB7AC98
MAGTGRIGVFATGVQHVAAILALVAWAGPQVGGGLTAEEPAATRSRHPVALAFSPDGSRLFVANRDSGSLSVVDPAGARVVAEHDVGRSLADVAALPDGRHLLAVDRGADVLLLLEWRDESARVIGRLAVGTDPVRLLAWGDGSRCAVTSNGARRVTLVDLTRGAGEESPVMKVSCAIELPFAPREMALVRDGSRLVVADGFGGKLAVIDPSPGTLESIRTLPAHNIRGLATSPDGRSLAVAHQTLHRLARSSFEDVHWGSLINNHLRFLRVDAVTTAGTDADLLRGGILRDLGGPGDAAGDPSGLAFGRSGDVLVALGGVGEVALGRDPWSEMRRAAVGGGPSAVAIDPKGAAGYVADGFDDTISVVDLATGARVRTIPLGDRPRPTPVALGERLFRDARLSHDGWMSCHSCHTDGHTNGLLADTQGDDSFGTPKRVPSLRGVGATGPWNWTGSSDRLEDQVRKSIETTMRGPSPSDDQVDALVAYLGSLPTTRPTASVAAADAVERGRGFFLARRCGECHAPPNYTSAGSYDVGLADEAGHRKFNPPSLLEAGVRGTYFHDGRAKTLEEVFVKFRHPRDAATSPEEAADLAAFLRSL